MTKKPREKYGGRGRPWHPDFISYVEEIAKHPVYSGMPDAIPAPGRVQWEAPSNRASGQFKDTHHKRRRWWEAKAASIGIKTTSANWISRTAKTIHPFKRKPCKICGRVLELRYVYPQDRLLNRIAKLKFVGESFELSRLEPITNLVRRLHAAFGDAVLFALPELLATSNIRAPSPPPRGIEAWITWLDTEYVPAEPRILSSGAMSNAPDRFDGFHSDNLCCRGTADKGRTKKNLSSYVTDRRVFEYWASGDWIAADRMMGLLRSVHFEKQNCRNSHSGPCSADHIGPISLGFAHRPCFQALCKSCNSGKNNRMSASDVGLLIKHEKSGETVISWHSQALWDICKLKVKDNETALRLSKLLRDNRHSLMAALQAIAEAGHYSFLATLLELDFADFDVEFVDIAIEDHVTTFKSLVKTPRKTKYAAEQKARRCRIAFQELVNYFEKDNRNSFVSSTPEAIANLEKCLEILNSTGPTKLDGNIRDATLSAGADADNAFLALIDSISALNRDKFKVAMDALRIAMDLTGRSLSQMWDDDRYVRS